MRFVFIAVLLTAASPFFAADDVYQPLWLYQGHWKGTKKNLDSTTAQFDIVNDCARIGRFFGCQQTVDGKPGPLILFVPSGPAGHYYTQAVQPEGFAMGRGELTIDGDHWTYMGKGEENGKSTYSKTTNAFSGKDRIHFELFESTDGEHWTSTGSGEEIRSAKSEH